MGNEEEVKKYFVCSVKGGAHCDKDGDGNQKVEVTVRNNCPTEGKSFISLTPVILSSRYSVMPTFCHWEMAIFSCLMLKTFKIPILDCTSDTDCQEPQPICNTASGKCHSCTDTEYSCTNAETCDSQSGRCVNAGLKFWDKSILLWVEALLCLPYVSLIKKRKEKTVALSLNVWLSNL